MIVCPKHRLRVLFPLLLFVFGSSSCRENAGQSPNAIKEIQQSESETVALTESGLIEVATNAGKFVVQLDSDRAPITDANFLSYVDKGHFDGTIFHRVIEDFMIQGGGFAAGEPPSEKETGDGIKNEAKTSGLKNEKYTVAMARTPDPDSATAQFFVNLKDNSFLDPNPQSPDGYAVFGKVVKGQEVVDKIGQVQTATKVLESRQGARTMQDQHPDVPVEPVIIESVKRIEKLEE